MVTIVDKNGENKIVCTNGTYEEIYKKMGYHLDSSKKKKESTKEVVPSLEKKELSDVDSEKEELSSKYGLKSKKTAETSKKEEK